MTQSLLHQGLLIRTTNMKFILRYLKPIQTVYQRQQQLTVLTDEVAKLRHENNSMRSGMRRCVTCDYRLDYKQRQRDVHSIPTTQACCDAP